MRLNCTVVRRDRQLASLAMAGKRPSASVLSIGLKTNKGDVAIIHHSIQTKENTTYAVSIVTYYVFYYFTLPLA